MLPVNELRLAFYGDDFTGSVDVLLQTMRQGWRGRLFLGLPDPVDLQVAAKDHDVVGIAGVARSLPTAQLEAEVRPVFEALTALGPHVLQYKVCSTADSSPEVGSIGRVIEVGRDVVGSRGPVPVLFAQPDFGRYTNFGHHFAADDGVVYRLDRQPTMSRHPVTPMRESDLAAHLSSQTALLIGNVHWTDYTDPSDVADKLRARSDGAVVFDAVCEQHVDLVAAVVLSISGMEGPRFVVGSGGLSRGLARAFSGPEDGDVRVHHHPGVDGPVLAVSGSRSPRTFRQIQDALEQGWVVTELPLDGSSDDDQVVHAAVAQLRSGRSVVVSTGADARPGLGGDAELVNMIASRLADLVEQALRAEVTRRVIVCGGDTSSRVLGLLGARSLTIVANPVDNVVVCAVDSDSAWLDGVEVLLKGGQVGPVGLFETIRTLHADLGPNSGAPRAGTG